LIKPVRWRDADLSLSSVFFFFKEAHFFLKGRKLKTVKRGLWEDLSLSLSPSLQSSRQGGRVETMRLFKAYRNLAVQNLTIDPEVRRAV
jgi:hypothetical protein